MWKIRKNKRETAFDAERVQKAAHAPLHSVHELLHASTLGLTDEEVEKRHTVFGKNERGGCKAGSGILASRWLSAGKGNPICRKGKKKSTFASDFTGWQRIIGMLPARDCANETGAEGLWPISIKVQTSSIKRTHSQQTMKMTRRITILLLACLCPLLARAQWFSGEYTSEWQWDMQKETNWVNLLRLNLSVPVWKGKGSLEAATLHVARTGESIIEDWQGFSNIFADNQVASIAVLGYMHEWQNAHLFAGVRNVNEDFFVTDITSLFTNSSCGIFPTIASSYPIANYPLSGLTLYFDVEKDGWTFKNSLYNGAGYNGWKRQNNPFLIKPKRDGVFNMSQLEYEHAWGHYLAGLSIHSRQFAIDEEGNMLPPQEARRKTTCAWWLYGEQPLWKSDQRSIACMAQYSENTSKRNACYRYAELGAAYRDSLNECGLSGQYAQFLQGTEYTVEATWRRQVNRILAVQPSIQYVNNKNGNFVVLSARLRCNF